MRFLVREQSYESPVASGRLRHTRAGEPTGVIENWRLNDAVDGYRILRIDWDGRQAVTAVSQLYHLLLAPNEQPERLTFRYWGEAGHKIEGNLFFELDQIICSRTVNGTRLADFAMDRTAPLLWWLPASVTMSAFAGLEPAVYDGFYLDDGQECALIQLQVKVEAGVVEEVWLMGRPIQARSKIISWADQQRTVWFDEHNWPVLVQESDLLATEIRYVRRNRKS